MDEIIRRITVRKKCRFKKITNNKSMEMDRLARKRLKKDKSCEKVYGQYNQIIK